MVKYSSLVKGLESTPRRWLVTGAAGFIGSNLCLRLLELNQTVCGLDNLSTGQRKNIDQINEQAKKSGHWEFFEADIGDQNSTKRALKDVDYVLHQAALGSVPRSMKDPVNSHKNNVDGFLKILWESHLAQVKKFVFASSSSVYGSDTNLPKVESQIGSPLSPYAATKRIDEIYADSFFQSYKLPTVGLRYFNVFGPRQSPEGPYAAVIPIWIENMTKGQAAIINGDGSNSRDFCYIENVIQANILAALSDDRSNGRVFNIAFEKRTTLLELHDLIQNQLKEIRPQLSLLPPQHNVPRPGDVPHSLADISLARSVLGFNPEIDLVEGLRKTILHFLNSKKE